MFAKEHPHTYLQKWWDTVGCRPHTFSSKSHILGSSACLSGDPQNRASALLNPRAASNKSSRLPSVDNSLSIRRSLKRGTTQRILMDSSLSSLSMSDMSATNVSKVGGLVEARSMADWHATTLPACSNRVANPDEINIGLTGLARANPVGRRTIRLLCSSRGVIC